MRVLKTWTNAWATSHRFHEKPLLPCLFGCKEIDKLSHYVQCPALASLVRSFSPSLPACPLARFGLVDTSRESLLIVAATFEGYHAVKRKTASLKISERLTLLPMNFVDQLRVTFRQAFWAACLDCKLQCRHYSPVPTLQLADQKNSFTDEPPPDLELLHRVFFLNTFFPEDSDGIGAPALVCTDIPG